MQRLFGPATAWIWSPPNLKRPLNNGVFGRLVLKTKMARYFWLAWDQVYRTSSNRSLTAWPHRPATSAFPPSAFQNERALASFAVARLCSMMFTLLALQFRSFCLTITVDTSIPCKIIKKNKGWATDEEAEAKLIELDEKKNTCTEAKSRMTREQTNVRTRAHIGLHEGT